MDAATVYLARTLIDQACETWNLPHLRDDARVVANELITNALAETPGQEITMWAVHEEQTLLIKVRDPSPRFPELQNPQTLDENGRGLRIVSTLCNNNCGTEKTPNGGKTIWARLKT